MTSDSDEEAKRRRNDLVVYIRGHAKAVRLDKFLGKGIASVVPEKSPPPTGPTDDQLAWVREAIGGVKDSLDKAFDGLKHSQSQSNAFVKWALGIAVAAMVAIVGYQSHQISQLGAKIDAAKAEVIAGVNIVGRDVVDVRERVGKLEGQISGISELLSKFQRGALEPGFRIEPQPMTDKGGVAEREFDGKQPPSRREP